MNKLVCLGLSILEISKIVMRKFWYDYVKPKYREKAKLSTWIQIALQLHKNKIHLQRHYKG